jgi:hypothetical protein
MANCRSTRAPFLHGSAASSGWPRAPRISAVGTQIVETGTLVREGAAFVLRRDVGGLFRLEMSRVPVNNVGKRVCITGTVIAQDLVSVDGVAPEG